MEVSRSVEHAMIFSFGLKLKKAYHYFGLFSCIFINFIIESGDEADEPISEIITGTFIASIRSQVSFYIH